MSEAAELLAVARRMALIHGSRKTAGAFLNVAAMILLRAGIDTNELNGAMADALRDFDSADIAPRVN